MRKLSRQTKRDLVAYSFIAPNFIGFCVFTLIPIIFAFALAFMKWDGSNPIQWAGISNFTRLWKILSLSQHLKTPLFIVSVPCL